MLYLNHGHKISDGHGHLGNLYSNNPEHNICNTTHMFKFSLDSYNTEPIDLQLSTTINAVTFLNMTKSKVENLPQFNSEISLHLHHVCLT